MNQKQIADLVGISLERLNDLILNGIIGNKKVWNIDDVYLILNKINKINFYETKLLTKDNGRYHNLLKIKKSVIKKYGHIVPCLQKIPVVWANYKFNDLMGLFIKLPNGKCLITINKLLDQPWTPKAIIEHEIFHEALHFKFAYHSNEFRNNEELFKNIKKIRLWREKNRKKFVL